MAEPEKKMSIHERLRKIQLELKAPKSQYNAFGKYYYRNVEDIQEAVKPLNNEYGVTLCVTDDLVLIGDRYYVKASAEITDDAGASIFANGFAREEEDKKGMDSAQITGAASSYARKYALNGLYAIDDTKDADSQDNTASSKATAKSAAPKTQARPADAAPQSQKWNDPVTPQQKNKLKVMMETQDMDKEEMTMFINSVLNKETVNTYAEYKKVVKALEDQVEN